MKGALEHFKGFSNIQRCSYKAGPMKEYIIEFAKGLGYEVKIDSVENVLCTKGRPSLALQSHYDMVCIGEAPNLNLYEEDGWLKAKNSTLGADNGMGVAIMFEMMEGFDDLECLFTSDEEVGLIGANNIELELSSKYLLNLDSEDEGIVVIGCAGGVNLIGELNLTKKEIKGEGKTYKVSIDGLPGGHSGLQIDQNIPSATKELVYELVRNRCKLIDINGGEMSNSIAKSAYAHVFSDSPLKIDNDMVRVEEVSLQNPKVLEQSAQILGFLNSFAQGVRSYNKELGMPNSSINLSTVRVEGDKLIIDCFGRSMSKEGIEILKSETTSLYEGFGFSVQAKGRAVPWKPEITNFTNIIKDALEEFYSDVKVEAVHAGLECGVIQSRQEKYIEVASIGPNIKNAHSIEEKCEISSVLNTSKAVVALIRKLQK